MPSDPDTRHIVEAVLLCAAQPLTLRELRALFEDTIDARAMQGLLHALQRDWQPRGLELVEVASGWRFQSRAAMQPWMERLHAQKPPRYSRAVLETLAIIAWHQPVTRGDIEDIRGVPVGSQILGQLQERGWVEAVGRRETPGRPELLATTRQFLDDLGLQSLGELPPLHNPAHATPQSAQELPSAAPDLPAPRPFPGEEPGGDVTHGTGS